VDPPWSLVVIALNVFVIWSITTSDQGGSTPTQ
jgi:hypothetical protein